MKEQIDRIKLILDTGHFTECLDCNFKYLPLDRTYVYICPNCESLGVYKKDE